MINKFNSEDKNIAQVKSTQKKIKKDKDGNIESISKEVKENKEKFMNKERSKSCIIMLVTLLILAFLGMQTWLLGKSILGKEVNKNSMILSNAMDVITGLFLKPQVPVQPIIEESEIKIGAVGDIYITNGMLSSYKTNNEYNFDKAFEQINVYTQNYDYVIANLETPIAGDATGLSTTKKYNAPVSLLSSLKKANINVLNLANERIYDKGEDGIINTIKNINESELKYVGVSNDNSPSQPLILEKDGLKIAVLSYNDETLKLPNGKENLVSTCNLDKVKGDIESLKDKNVDGIVAYVHYGSEGQSRPTARQREITQQLYELGVDVVLGSHPHVIQPVSDEVFNINEESKKRVYVAYSLGDLLGTSTEEDSDFGILAGVTFKKTVKKNQKGEVISTSVSLLPDEVTTIWQDKKLKSGKTMKRAIPIEKGITEYEQKLDEDISSSDYFQMIEALKNAQKILIRQ